MSYESLSQWGDIFALSGSIIIWFGLIIFGYIAKKYETMFGKKTNWIIYVLAPTGVLLYAIIMAYYYTTIGSLPKKTLLLGLTVFPQITAYALTFLSALFILWCSLNFKKITQFIK